MGRGLRVFTASAKVEERGATVGRIAVLVVLGALLAGCDSCGDWRWSPLRGEAHGEPQACREQAPRPQ